MINKNNIRKVIKTIRIYLEKQFPKLTRIFWRLRDERYINKYPGIISSGFKFNGNKTMESGQYELEETILVKKLFSKVDIFINVGANIGYYVCLAAQAKKLVIAFEPIEINIKYLLRNIFANGWGNDVEIYPIVLSNKTGVVPIYGRGLGASLIKGWAKTSDQDSNLAPCSTMNIILGNRLDKRKILILIDVEGAEDLLLDGSSILLGMSPKPIWLVEISASSHHLPKDIIINPNLLKTFDRFWSLGYEARTVDKLSRIVEKEEIQKIMDTQIDTLGCHNFLFYQKEENLFQTNKF